MRKKKLSYTVHITGSTTWSIKTDEGRNWSIDTLPHPSLDLYVPNRLLDGFMNLARIAYVPLIELPSLLRDIWTALLFFSHLLLQTLALSLLALKTFLVISGIVVSTLLFVVVTSLSVFIPTPKRTKHLKRKARRV